MISFMQYNGFRFFFAPIETPAPAHVHVIGRGGQLVVWLKPLEAALNHNMSSDHQQEAINAVRENLPELLEKWNNWAA